MTTSTEELADVMRDALSAGRDRATGMLIQGATKEFRFDPAKKSDMIVHAIIEDMKVRYGFRDEWGLLDGDGKIEIAAAWCELAMNHTDT